MWGGFTVDFVLLCFHVAQSILLARPAFQTAMPSPPDATSRATCSQLHFAKNYLLELGYIPESVKVRRGAAARGLLPLRSRSELMYFADRSPTYGMWVMPHH